MKIIFFYIKNISLFFIKYKYKISFWLWIITFFIFFYKFKIFLIFYVIYFIIFIKIYKFIKNKKIKIKLNSYIDNLLWKILWFYKNKSVKNNSIIFLIIVNYLLGISLQIFYLWLKLYEEIISEYEFSYVKNNKKFIKFFKNIWLNFKENHLLILNKIDYSK